LVSPASGAVISTSHPLLSWTLPPNENSYAIYVSRRPETTPDGKFLDENLVDVDLLKADAGEWSPASPVYAGAYWWQVVSQDRQTLQLFRSPPSSFTIAARARIASVRTTRWTFLHELGITVRTRANTKYGYVSATVRTLRGARLWSGRKRQSFYPPNSVESMYFRWRTRSRVPQGRRLRLRVTLRAGGVVRATSRTFRAP
jgi:hypothetical protein